MQTPVRNPKIGAAIICLVIGSIFVFYAMFTTKTITNTLVENEVINTGSEYNQSMETISFSENVSPVVVKGSVTEIEGRHFNFYVFNEQNFEIFTAGLESFNALKAERYVSEYNFEFTPPFEGDYYFVASTVEPPIPRVLELSATYEWQVTEIDWAFIVIGVFIFVFGLALAGIPFPFTFLGLPQ